MPRPKGEPRLHPRQVRIEVTMSNGVTNTLIFTLHRGDYSFVQDVTIEGVAVAYTELPEEKAKKRSRCVTQEVGHKVPASTIRKADGRLVGSCETCHERINIARFPASETVAEAKGVFHNVLFNANGDQAEGYLTRIGALETKLEGEIRAAEEALRDVRRARAVIIGRTARTAGA